MSDPDPSIHSILRVNPVGFVIDDIDLNTDVKEISLLKVDYNYAKKSHDYETWIYEEVLEKTDEFDEGLRFSSQEDAFRGFQKWYENSVDPARGADSLTCVAVGGRGSGKSHTLFGPDTNRDRGIIPRFLTSRFDTDDGGGGHQGPASFILISMYMVHGDSLFDLLNPPHETTVRNHNFAYSDSLGVIPLTVVTLRAESAAHSLQLVNLGLKAASMISLSSDFLFNGVDIVVSFRMFHLEKVSCMTFVEVSSMLYLPSTVADSDRFSSQVHELRAAQACAECGLFGSTGGHSDHKKRQAKAQKAINSSFLTYLLQDAFILGGCPLYPTNLSACLVIGCLRGDRESYSENKFTLNLIQTLSERFQSLLEDTRVGGGGGSIEDLNSSTAKDRTLVSSGSAERPNSRAAPDRPGSKASDRPGSRNTRYGLGSGASGLSRARSASSAGEDSAAMLPHKSMTRDMLTLKLEQEITALDAMRQRDQQTLKVSRSLKKEAGLGSEEEGKVERRVQFFDRKQSHLEKILKHVMKCFMLTNKMKRHDVKVIATWLKERGLYGLRLAKEHNSGRENPEHHVRKEIGLRRYKGGAGPFSAEEVEISNMPWCADHMPTDPYLVPVTPVGFSSTYLLLPIPIGHLAFCQSLMKSHYREGATIPAQKPLTFPGAKNVRVLLLNSMKINRKHCMMFRVGSTIKIRPLVDDEDSGMMAFVEVNGVPVLEEQVLSDLDVIRLGAAVMFIVHIPEDSDNEEEGEVNAKTGSAKSKYRVSGKSDHGRERVESLKSNRSVIGSVSAEGRQPQDDPSVPPLALLEGVASGHWDDCVSAASSALLFDVVQQYLERRNLVRHSEVDRAIVKITSVKAKSEAQKMTSYIPNRKEVSDIVSNMSVFHTALLAEAIQAVGFVNFWAKEMRKNVVYSVHLRPRQQQSGTTFVARQYRGAELGVKVDGRYFDIVANAEVLDGGQSSGRGDSWWWSVTILLQRLSLIRAMYHEFVWKFDRQPVLLDDEYPPEKDPFLDPSEPELLGVANVHLDSLFYLMDVRDTARIVTFKGVSGGLLKFSLRCWIDQVDTIASYIKVDEECKLTDFLGKKCIMKFYFESMIGINPALSNDIQIAFNFFVHSGQYRTPRHAPRNDKTGDVNPYLNNIVVMEQKITPDFIDYVQKKSIELEIWGGRIFNKRIVVKQPEKRRKYVLGDPKVYRNPTKPIADGRSSLLGLDPSLEDPSTVIELQSQVSDGDLSSAGVEEEEEEDELKEEDDDPALLLRKLKEVTALLDEAERRTKRSVRSATLYKDEIARLTPSKAGVQKSSVAEAMAISAETQQKDAEIERMRNEIASLQASMSKGNKSKACIIS